LGDNAPDWYLSMDQFLQLVNEVVKASNNDWAFAGRNIHETAHPEDLAIGVVAAAEMVSLTLVALAHLDMKKRITEKVVSKKK
jgi:hypothetical protein